MTIRRPALRFYGSKWRLAPDIIALFPAHSCYCEPFGGSATVLLQKPPSPIEVYNDADGLLVNFFRVLRERPAELMRLIELTPHSRAELRVALSHEGVDDLESARRLYVQSWQSWSGAAGGRGASWRYDRNAGSSRKLVNDAWNEYGHLEAVARRLKSVQLEHDDAFAIIPRYDTPGTLYYVDPPYPAATRSTGGRNGYRFELTEGDHERLAGVLREIQGMAIVSSYPSELYDDLFGGWKKIEKEVRVEQSRPATEVLWLSPACEASRLPMFAAIDKIN